MSAYPQIWITNETPPRYLIAKGRSLLDPDCLVAETEGSENIKALWIVDDKPPPTAKPKWCYVCGLGGSVRAILASSIETTT